MLQLELIKSLCCRLHASWKLSIFPICMCFSLLTECFFELNSDAVNRGGKRPLASPPCRNKAYAKQFPSTANLQFAY